MSRYLEKLKRFAGHRMPLNNEKWDSAAPKLFIHIPKTAGTSFRSAAESFFGSSRVLRDYGAESEDTSQSVKEHVYASGDPSAIVHALSEQKAKLVSGHFPVTKYREVFCLSDTATLIRNPVDQVVSHYQHLVRFYGHRGELMDFARQPQYQNVQSQFIGMLDPALIGIVGPTEAYRSFLKILNEQWHWSLPHRRRNVGNRLGIGRIRLTPDDRLEIERLNAIDAGLYRRAKQVFANRKQAYESGISSDIRGGLTCAAPGRDLKGWALDMRSNAPVTVDVVVNGECVASASCDRPLPEYSDWKLPGTGLAGFAVSTLTLEKGNLVEIRDSDRGFVLDSSQVQDAD